MQAEAWIDLGHDRIGSGQYADPLPNNGRNSFTGPQSTWTCISQSPGMRQVPDPSITLAPAGMAIALSSPTAEMRFPLITTAVQDVLHLQCHRSAGQTVSQVTYSPVVIATMVGDWNATQVP